MMRVLQGGWFPNSRAFTLFTSAKVGSTRREASLESRWIGGAGCESGAFLLLLAARKRRICAPERPFSVFLFYFLPPPGAFGGAP
jgi:hypothetical protein